MHYVKVVTMVPGTNSVKRFQLVYDELTKIPLFIYEGNKNKMKTILY